MENIAEIITPRKAGGPPIWFINLTN